MINSIVNEYSKVEVIRFNNIHDIVDINVKTWCKIFGINFEQYQMLSIKNPPLDSISKSLLFFMAEVKKNYDYVGFMRLVDNMNHFLIKYASEGIDKKDRIFQNACSMCGTTIKPNQKYCSSVCRQKSYRLRKKALS